MRHILLAALVLASGCAAPGDGDDTPTATVEDLLEADRAFGRATAERRLDTGSPDPPAEAAGAP